MPQRQIVWQTNINDAYGCVIQKVDGSMSVEVINGDPAEHAEDTLLRTAEDADVEAVLYVDKKGFKDYERQSKRKQIKRQKIAQDDGSSGSEQQGDETP